MSVYRRGKIYWYKFWFANKLILRKREDFFEDPREGGREEAPAGA